MPMPKPAKGEAKKDWTKRCMSSDIMVKEYKDKDQRFAVCESLWEGKMKSNLLTLKSTVTQDTFRQETFKGDSYLVVPAVLMTEGVHNKIYYQMEELSKVIPAWNGIPVSVGHPETDQGFVSCQSPDVLEQYHIGWVFNTYTLGKKIIGEAWINEKWAEEVAPGLLDSVKGGTKFEVSSSFFGDLSYEQGQWNEEAFDAIIYNLRMDHLAVLMDERGACNWEDGCGMPRNNTEGGRMGKQTRKVSYNGREKRVLGPLSFSMSKYVDGYYRHNPEDEKLTINSVVDMDEDIREWVASRTLAGISNAECSAGLLSYPVVNPITNKLNKPALQRARFQGARQGQQDVVVLAGDLLSQEFGERPAQGDFELLGAMSRGVFEAYFPNQMSDIELRQTLSDALVKEYGGPNVGLFLSDVYPDYLIFEQWRVQGDSLAIDEGLKLMKQEYSIDDSGVVTFDGRPVEVRVERNYVPVPNTTQGEETEMGKACVDKVKEFIQNKKNPFTEEDQAWISGLDETAFKALEERMEAQAGSMQTDEEDPGTPDEEQGDEVAATPADSAGEQQPAANSQAPATVAQYINQAPPEMRAALQSMQRQYLQHKKALVSGILNNAQNQFSEKELMAMDDNVLEKMAAMAVNEQDSSEVDFSLLGGTLKSNSGQPGREVLPLPKLGQRKAE